MPSRGIRQGRTFPELCFVSWDPELYVNPGATCFTVREPPGHPADNICTVCQDAQGLHHSVGADRKWRAVGAHHREWYARQAVAIAVKMLDASTEGARHAARTKAACLLGGYVGGGILTYAAAIAGLAPAVRRNTTNLPEAMQTIEDCLKAGIQAPITFEALEHARRAWKGRHWLSRPRVWTGSFATIDAGEVLPWHE